MISSFEYYLEIANRHPPLPYAEEQALMDRIAHADSASAKHSAVDRLVKHNIMAALHEAKKRSRNFPGKFDELVSIAVQGLLSAAGNAEATGVPFSSYCRKRVNGALTEFLGSLPVIVVNRRAHRKLTEAERKGEPLGKTARLAKEALGKVLSLDADAGWKSVAYDGSPTLHQEIEHEAPTPAEQAEESIDRDYARERVACALANLPVKRKKVIEMRFGLGCEPHSLKQIASAFGLSTAGAQFLEQEALKTLRSTLSKDECALIATGCI